MAREDNKAMESKSFIQYVASDLIEKYGQEISRLTVVFPNKRAALFLNKALADISDKPIWSPSYITISELFQQFSDRTVADELQLLCLLYRSYKKITHSSETIDEFFGWGQTLLADFDDIDKNMANARQVFRDISNLHELDAADTLNDDQKRAIKSFFSTFSLDHNSMLRERFLTVWNRLYDVYNDFNQALSSQNLAYEGSIFREVASKDITTQTKTKYIFVGFNLLQKSESTLFKTLNRAGQADFYWDFDHYYNNVESEAGRFIRQHLETFTNNLDPNSEEIYDNFSKPKNISYISASTENAQARYVSQWLTDKRVNDGSRTAIVLCDENLLQSITYSLPPMAKDINITSGYPLSQTPIAALIRLLIDLQVEGRRKQLSKFRLKYVARVLQHRYVSLIIGDGIERLNHMKSTRMYYVSKDDLLRSGNAEAAYNSNIDLIFSALDSENYNLMMTEWLIKIVEQIAVAGKKQMPNDAFFQESVFRMYRLLCRIRDLIATGDLTIDNSTYQRIIRQIISTTKIPFHGEPIKGVQIMGVLETRNLDFDNLLILSCNEGNMPKQIYDTSFIPYSIKKAFELTTVDNKVAIYAYYFYRLIQRAKDVTILYNNATGDRGVNEMSHFMLQMMVESGHKIELKHIQTILKPHHTKCDSIVKDENIIKQLNAIDRIYPTDINNYLRCQKKFYYQKVAKLKELDDIDDDAIDNRMFGNIFHAAAEILYNQLKDDDGKIGKERIQQALGNQFYIKNAIDKAIEEQINISKTHSKTDKNTATSNDSSVVNEKIEGLGDCQIDTKKLQVGANANTEEAGMQLINREVIAEYLRQLLRIDMRLAPLTILNLEGEYSVPITILQLDRRILLKGRIDRLDQVETEPNKIQIRVIDYKTGRNTPKNIKTIEDVFSEDLIESHSDYFLQTMLYAYIVHNQPAMKEIPIAPALIFIGHTANDEYNPILKFGNEHIDDIKPYAEQLYSELQNLLSHILNPENPFLPTSKTDRCTSCSYRKICYQ